VQLDIELPQGLSVVTAAERPTLWEQVEADDVFSSVWPEYNNHGDVAAEYFDALVPRFADFQVLGVVGSEPSDVVARGRTIPFTWGGNVADLPAGIDALGVQAIKSDLPTSLCALAAEVIPSRQGQGISAVVLQAMTAVAAQHRLAPLVAPVRPSWKDRYPLVRIEDYAYWRDGSGLPFDPWMRVHTRLGARILRPEPESLRITAPITEWEAWTGMTFPTDGDYVFPRGLAPLQVRAATGYYWEPNVWMVHEQGLRRPDAP
jgi:GNAT superfamily N-acetyltransferase